MMSVNTNNQNGYTIHRGVTDVNVSKRHYLEILEEICNYVLVEKTSELVTKFGLDVTKLFNDRDCQLENGLSEKYIRKASNSRESKIVRKNGRSDIYFSRAARSICAENTQIYNIMEELYSHVMGKVVPLAFTNGLDQLIVKSFGCEENLPTVNCKMFTNFEPPTGSNNPFSYFALYCYGIDKSLTINERGQVSILKNFDKYYSILAKWMAPGNRFDQGRQGKGSNVTILNNFNIQSVNNALREDFNSRNASHEFIPMEWVTLSLCSGDFVVMDCRVPYIFHKNETNTPAIYSAVSLLPVPDDWKTSKRRTNLIQCVSTGFVGNRNTRVLKGTNSDEFSWRQNNTIYTLDKSISHESFTTHEKMIYGLEVES
jgi:hypothetical protein